MSKVNQSLRSIGKTMHQIRLEAVMTKPVIVVNREEEFSVVEELFIGKGIRHLPVVNDQQQVVGMISQRDVYRRIAPRRALDGTVQYQPGLIVDGDGYYKEDTLFTKW